MAEVTEGQWRRVYVYDLAPVGSPKPGDWPSLVRDEVAERNVDNSLPPAPPDPSLPGAPDRNELYRRLAERAEISHAQPGTRTAVEYARSAAARDAVLLRADDQCENPGCAGMACDTRSDGTSILDVDHVNDLAAGGPDEPWNMVALCPNCHAAKTRGRGRQGMRRALAKVAR
jgi:5-methylcytosine-specific restriction protein A